MGALQLVFHVVEAPLIYFQYTNRQFIWVIPSYWKRENSGVVLDARLLSSFRRDMTNLWKVGSECLNILLRESNWYSSFLTASLHGSSTWHHNDKFGPKIRKDGSAGLAKTVAISKQHDDRGDPPGHAKHSQRRAAPIVTHRRVRFLEQI